MEKTLILDGETPSSESKKSILNRCASVRDIDLQECPRHHIQPRRTLSWNEITEKSCDPKEENVGKRKDECRKVKRGVSFKNDDAILHIVSSDRNDRAVDMAPDISPFYVGSSNAIKPPLLVQLPSFHSEVRSEVRSQVSQTTTSRDRTSLSSVRRTPISSLPLIEDQIEYLPSEFEFKGFKTINPKTKCCICPPRPSMMNTRGWLTWGFLCVVFWPLSFLPCIMSCSYDPYQIPVYDRITKMDDSR